ncbi:hypothetical protein DLAC_02664 [Tieghemostelium lacteum]|uniref:RING-type domain-containing protein n=1 Tax=Tieghemostelium lacteum TaxID=361077 RepID=A0A152A3G4_TIELA|nr:hypothetical protein DLAC_02664 [Tieghemostelium lacteum]|eukprot:KYR00637.1 hypothetical protein DLAC_02664 [Tieghemostelium lacteum]
MNVLQDFLMDENGVPLDLERIQFILKHRPTPPISEYHFKEMTEEIEVTKKNKERLGDCSICTVDFPLEDYVIKLPCKHYFHFDCITKWLGMHSVCPNCRFELPTEDSEYDAMRRYVREHEKSKEKTEDKDEEYNDRFKNKGSARNNSMYS